MFSRLVLTTRGCIWMWLDTVCALLLRRQRLIGRSLGLPIIGWWKAIVTLYHKQTKESHQRLAVWSIWLGINNLLLGCRDFMAFYISSSCWPWGYTDSYTTLTHMENKQVSSILQSVSLSCWKLSLVPSIPDGICPVRSTFFFLFFQSNITRTNISTISGNRNQVDSIT